jgi:hypothetical protein
MQWRRQRVVVVLPGAADLRWDDDDLGQMRSVPGSAFEVVDTGPVRH